MNAYILDDSIRIDSGGIRMVIDLYRGETRWFDTTSRPYRVLSTKKIKVTDHRRLK